MEGLGKRRHRAAGVAVELHEDEVPDLEPAVAVARRAEALPACLLLGARQVLALVEVDLRARAARTGVAHRPEVVLLPEAEDAVVAHSRDLLPESNASSSSVNTVALSRSLGSPAVAGQELPAVGDGVRLEVVAEREVAEHLEEGVMARGAPDVLEVVVLATGAHALLRGRRAHVISALLAEEHALELHHPRVGEEQRRVLGGHERRGAHHGVAVLPEVLEKAPSKIAAGNHKYPRRGAAPPFRTSPRNQLRRQSRRSKRRRQGAGLSLWLGLLIIRCRGRGRRGRRPSAA